MAQYDFVCRDCGNAFEVFVRGLIKDADKQCPQCGSVSVRQKFSSFLSGGSSSSPASGCDTPVGSPFG